MTAINTKAAKLDIDHSANTRYRAIEEHLYSEIKDEAVILNLANGKYYGLNAVGVTIWKILLRPASLVEIETAVLKEFDVDAKTCRSETAKFLEGMIEERLVSVDA